MCYGDQRWRPDHRDQLFAACTLPRDTSRVEIRRTGALLWSKSLSAHAPIVNITGPRAVVSAPPVRLRSRGQPTIRMAIPDLRTGLLRRMELNGLHWPRA